MCCPFLPFPPFNISPDLSFLPFHRLLFTPTHTLFCSLLILFCPFLLFPFHCYSCLPFLLFSVYRYTCICLVFSFTLFYILILPLLLFSFHCYSCLSFLLFSVHRYTCFLSCFLFTLLSVLILRLLLFPLHCYSPLVLSHSPPLIHECTRVAVRL